MVSVDREEREAIKPHQKSQSKEIQTEIRSNGIEQQIRPSFIRVDHARDSPLSPLCPICGPAITSLPPNDEGYQTRV